MPQLDTSTWFIIILASTTTLFLMIQLKLHTHVYSPNPTPMDLKTLKHNCPWDKKWTKIYLPHS
uniref:ATP synthase F0 subunit 8 n=1 Tax=Muscardinus avellanarius TaxID=39082 RepID=UPI00165F5065|nr:ATP synthase F0 subunit 8 [Muscardinus avellanarius]QLM00985.1 ATP synthase F0 subunit 8 [Muscardinus avellanarius]